MSTPPPPRAAEPAAPFRIGDWSVWPDRNEIARDGQVKRLQRRLMLLLVELAAAPETTHTREALLAAAWRRRVVNDEVLSRSIADLRVALEDDAREPRYIRTIPKLGYRLLATVQPLAAPDQPAQPASAPPRRAPLVAVAFGALALVALALVVSRQRAPQPSDPVFSAANLLRARPFTSGAEWEQTARFAPDGALIAYSLGDGAQSNAQIWLASPDGLMRRAFTHDADSWNICPVFAADGRELYWMRHRGHTCRVIAQPLVGGAERELGACWSLRLSCMDRSEDGRLLVFTAPALEGRAAGLALLELDSGATRVLTAPRLSDGDDTDPRFRPGADEVTFTRGNDWGRTLYRVALAGTAPVKLSGADDLSFGHAWNARGDAAVFASDALGYRALLALAPDGAVALLGARGARYPDVARNGALVYELASYDANLWYAALDGSGTAPRKLTHSARYDSQPDLDIERRRVVFQSNRDGLDSIWVAPLEDGGIEQRLPFDPALRWSQASWSPDGASVIATGYEGSDTRIWRLTLASGRAASLPLGAAPHGAHYSPDGAWIYFLRGREHARALWRVDTNDINAAPQKIAEGVDQYRLRGARLAYSHADRVGLAVCALDGSACRETGIAIDRDNRGAWDLAGERIYFVARDAAAGRREVLRQSLADGARESVDVPVPSAVGTALAVAPDESFLISARNDKYDVDLMYVPPP